MNAFLKALKKVKDSSFIIANLKEEKRNKCLLALAESLQSSSSTIIKENNKDLALMDKYDPKYDRLLLSEARINAIAEDVIKIASLPTVLNTCLEESIRPNGLKIQKVAVPLGVVAVIYESRPNVTIDVFALCFKTGNACVLKGGKEAWHTNRYLVDLIEATLLAAGLPKQSCYLLPAERKAALELLSATGYVDVCIPRGSQSLINFVRANAKIPVIETGAGIVHTYFDVSGNAKKGSLIILNAKTRRVSVCNALDTLLIHENSLSLLPQLVESLSAHNVEIFADLASYTILESVYPKHLLSVAEEPDFGHEFLDYKMAIKTVESLNDALAHIQKYSSGHSEAIIADDKETISTFIKNIDAAAVYVNASTAFTDGGEFGMGAEIGISTQKLHARGPMGMQALTSYKWVVWGEGQIRE
jgi:glutamate-5-semialdehyde dehydrogenase